MTAQTILLTGSTGHVGYATLIEALKKGYNIRAAVRSYAKAEVVKSAPTTKPYLSQLSFVIVKDITVSGAFDEAVKGVDGILHIASPIPSGRVADFEEDLIKPAIHGTTSILYSALKEKSIKRVVITSSTVATLADDLSTTVMKATDIVPEIHGPYDGMFAAYRASKTNANIKVREFIAEQKPHFDIISVAPSYVIGRNELATTTAQIADGSNEAMLGTILGKKNEQGTFNCVIHVDDVAHVHVASLDPKIPGNTNYAVDYDYTKGFRWEDSKKYAAEFFPEEVKSGLLPNNGVMGSVIFKMDATETERVFGIKFKTPAEMVKNIVGQYVAAAKAEA